MQNKPALTRPALKNNWKSSKVKKDRRHLRQSGKRREESL